MRHPPRAFNGPRGLLNAVAAHPSVGPGFGCERSERRTSAWPMHLQISRHSRLTGPSRPLTTSPALPMALPMARGRLGMWRGLLAQRTRRAQRTAAACRAAPLTFGSEGRRRSMAKPKPMRNSGCLDRTMRPAKTSSRKEGRCGDVCFAQPAERCRLRIALTVVGTAQRSHCAPTAICICRVRTQRHCCASPQRRTNHCMTEPPSPIQPT